MATLCWRSHNRETPYQEIFWLFLGETTTHCTTLTELPSQGMWPPAGQSQHTHPGHIQPLTNPHCQVLLGRAALTLLIPQPGLIPEKHLHSVLLNCTRFSLGNHHREAPGLGRRDRGQSPALPALPGPVPSAPPALSHRPGPGRCSPALRSLPARLGSEEPSPLLQQG